jgi:hypothetical protein
MRTLRIPKYKVLMKKKQNHKNVNIYFLPRSSCFFMYTVYTKKVLWLWKNISLQILVDLNVFSLTSYKKAIFGMPAVFLSFYF